MLQKINLKKKIEFNIASKTNNVMTTKKVSKNRVRHFLQSIILIIAVLSLQSFSNFNEKHIGEWKGEQRGETGTLILDNTNYAIFIIDNKVLGGDSFVTQKGNNAECKYEIDYSKNPIWLDIVVYVQDEQGKTEEMGRLKGIIRFITDTTMEYRVGFDGNRYENFDSEDEEDTIILHKVTN